jgi:hypothetical protein
VQYFKIESELEPRVLPPFKQGLGSLLGTYTQFDFQKYIGACTLDVKSESNENQGDILGGTYPMINGR